ncbi:MAG: glycosyltransferase family 2 protein, partial [Actinobacteria bacterium]|nr:glycosyltransferase family 2 protein [Actinomycetota bacterium]
MSSLENEKVVAVIPAYNEAERIGAVLVPVSEATLVDEVVVIDDGSTDGTAIAAERYPVRVVVRTENGGKGAAIETARAEVDADIIVYLDADLVGLKPEHVDALVRPLLEEELLMMTVGKFAGGRLRTDLAQKIVPTISGQRAVRREFIERMPDTSATRFGVEVVFTEHARKNGYKTTEVVIEGVTQVMKEEKHGSYAP